MPENAEELRARLKLLGHSFVFTRLRYASKAWLRTCTPQVIQEHTDYILGQDVYALAEHDPQGVPLPKPSFAVVLNYEHQVRKLQAKLINKGYNFETALVAAQKCTVIRERHFSTPNTREILARMKAEHESELQRLRQSGQDKGVGREGWGKRGLKRKHNDGGKGNPKGKDGKAGKQEGKGPKRTRTWFDKMPDGKGICFSYNNWANGCTAAKCRFVHACRKCQTEGHGAWDKQACEAAMAVAGEAPAKVQ